MLPKFQPRAPVVQLIDHKPIADYEARMPMTYILGMVGNDGVILASDKLVTEQIPASCTYSTQKIEIVEDMHLAYCWAGDNLCEITASILRTLKITPDTNVKLELILAAQNAYSIEVRTRAERHGMPFLGGIMLIAIQLNGNVQLWRLAISTPICADPISDKACAGDIYNTARFFAERYLPKGSLRPSLNELKFMAAHSVLMVGKLNSGIRDLEMVLCRIDGTFERLTDPNPELLALKEKSKALEIITAEHLGFRPNDI